MPFLACKMFFQLQIQSVLPFPNHSYKQKECICQYCSWFLALRMFSLDCKKLKCFSLLFFIPLFFLLLFLCWNISGFSLSPPSLSQEPFPLPWSSGSPLYCLRSHLFILVFSPWSDMVVSPFWLVSCCPPSPLLPSGFSALKLQAECSRQCLHSWVEKLKKSRWGRAVSRKSPRALLLNTGVLAESCIAKWEWKQVCWISQFGVHV